MNNTDYINKLNTFYNDLEIYMKSIPSGPNFENTKIYAEKIAPLITAQILKLRNNPLQERSIANPVELREHLLKLHQLMTEDEKIKFSEYIQLLDSIIIHDVKV